MTEKRALPAQQPPPVQWLRLRYCKRGRARFTSHRDVARALERALRRAGVPMAYSSGFSPHPRISWAGASATGAATEADYVELGLARRCEPDWVRDALTAALPEGIAVLEAVEWERGQGRSPSLADSLTASAWRIDLVGPAAEIVDAAVAAVLAAALLPVQRETKTGLRQFDARGAVLRLARSGDGLLLTLRHEVPLVRPDDVVAALSLAEPRFVLAQPALFTRLAQGEFVDGGIVGPFDAPAPENWAGEQDRAILTTGEDSQSS